MTSSFTVRLAAVGLAAACFSQSPSPHIEIRGLTESTGGKVLLINAKGSDCRETVVLSAAEPGVWADVTAQEGESTRRSKVFRVDVAPHVNNACWCAEQTGGIAVLAPGRASSYLPALLPYTKREGSKFFNRLCHQPLTIHMRDRRQLQLMVWAPDERSMPSMARDDIANADWIYDKELAGITLKPNFQSVKQRGDMPVCGDDEDDFACCDRAVRSRLFESNALNIYYGNGTRNFACRFAPVVFIHDSPVLGDAAHEIGHSLGLIERDHDPASDREGGKPAFDSGHTSDQPRRFNIDNVMWNGTHFLKNTLSPGQAFWMSHSCNSILNQGGSCARCVNTSGDRSPCPSLGTGQVKPSVEFADISEAPSLVPRHMDEQKKPEACRTPGTTYPSGLAIELALEQRYDALRRHTKGRRELELGAVGKGEFKDHWEPYFAIPLAKILDTAFRGDRAVLKDAVPGRIRYRKGLKGFVESLNFGEKLPIPGCGSK